MKETLTITEKKKVILTVALSNYLETLTRNAQGNKTFQASAYYKETLKQTQELLFDLSYPLLAKVKE